MRTNQEKTKCELLRKLSTGNIQIFSFKNLSLSRNWLPNLRQVDLPLIFINIYNLDSLVVGETH